MPLLLPGMRGPRPLPALACPGAPPPFTAAEGVKQPFEEGDTLAARREIKYGPAPSQKSGACGAASNGGEVALPSQPASRPSSRLGPAETRTAMCSRTGAAQQAGGRAGWVAAGRVACLGCVTCRLQRWSVPGSLCPKGPAVAAEDVGVLDDKQSSLGRWERSGSARQMQGCRRLPGQTSHRRCTPPLRGVACCCQGTVSCSWAARATPGCTGKHCLLTHSLSLLAPMPAG